MKWSTPSDEEIAGLCWDGKAWTLSGEVIDRELVVDILGARIVEIAEQPRPPLAPGSFVRIHKG